MPEFKMSFEKRLANQTPKSTIENFITEANKREDSQMQEDSLI